jgi:AcrR family transcriptional regulator
VIESGLAARTRRRHHQVTQLLEQGHTLRQICRQLGLSRGTVRRFARAEDVEDLVPSQRHSGRVSILAPYVEYLQRRFAEGVTNAATLYAEIHALGYRGSGPLVRRYLQPLRTGATPPPRTAALTTRSISSLLLRHPDDLDETEQRQQAHVRACCRHLDRLAEHVSVRRLPELCGRAVRCR